MREKKIILKYNLRVSERKKYKKKVKKEKKQIIKYL